MTPKPETQGCKHARNTKPQNTHAKQNTQSAVHSPQNMTTRKPDSRQPQTKNSKPRTQNPKPKTQNPKPKTCLLYTSPSPRDRG
eukprot:1589172-Rhodomonas_salina.1